MLYWKASTEEGDVFCFSSKRLKHPNKLKPLTEEGPTIQEGRIFKSIKHMNRKTSGELMAWTFANEDDDGSFMLTEAQAIWIDAFVRGLRLVGNVKVSNDGKMMEITSKQGFMLYVYLSCEHSKFHKPEADKIGNEVAANEVAANEVAAGNEVASAKGNLKEDKVATKPTTESVAKESTPPPTPPFTVNRKKKVAWESAVMEKYESMPQTPPFTIRGKKKDPPGQSDMAKEESPTGTAKGDVLDESSLCDPIAKWINKQGQNAHGKEMSTPESTPNITSIKKKYSRKPKKTYKFLDELRRTLAPPVDSIDLGETMDLASLSPTSSYHTGRQSNVSQYISDVETPAAARSQTNASEYTEQTVTPNSINSAPF